MQLLRIKKYPSVKILSIILVSAFIIPFYAVNAYAEKLAFLNSQEQAQAANETSVSGDVSASEDIASIEAELSDTNKVSIELPSDAYEKRPGPSTEDLATAKELPHERTETSATFRTNDGYKVLKLYAGPVHYLSEDRTYQDIDNTLVSAADGKSVENKANKFKARFKRTKEIKDPSKDKVKDLLTYKIKGHTISFGYPEAFSGTTPLTLNPTTEIVATTEISYPELFDGITLKYQVTSELVKENVLVEHYIPDLRLSYPFSISKDLTYHELGTGQVEFLDKTTEEVIFSFASPFMVEASTADESGERTSAVLTELLQDPVNEDDHTLTYTPNDAWLSDSARNYPVNIDPTLAVTGDNGAQDATVEQDSPNTNFNGSGELLVGESTYPSSHRRSLLQFDLSTVPSMYQMGTLDSAEIKMYKEKDYDGDDETRVHALYNKETWSEDTVTWNSDIDFDDDDFLDGWVDVDPEQFYSWDVKEITEEWLCRLENYNVNGLCGTQGLPPRPGLPNYGVTLLSDYFVAEPATTQMFYEKEATTRFAADRLPALEITYDDNIDFGLGLKGYWSYESRQLTEGLSAHVNQFTGNLVTRLDLPKLDGKLPLAPSFIFNSESGEDTKFGIGTRLNYAEKLVKLDKSVNYHDSEGTVLHFRATDDGYMSPPGENYRYATTDTTITISNNSGIDRTFTQFDATGEARLIGLSDAKGNALAITYASEDPTKMTEISDNVGNSLELDYDGTTGRLSSITDSTGVETLASYDANGYLTEVTELPGTSEERDLSFKRTFDPGGEYASCDSIYQLTDAVNMATTEASRISTTYCLNSQDQVVGIKYADEAEVIFHWNPVPVDPNGEPEPDGIHNKVKKTTPLGTFTYTMTAYGQVATLDRPGGSMGSVYDSDLNQVSYTNTLGETDTSTYHSSGNTKTFSSHTGSSSNTDYESTSASPDADNLTLSTTGQDFQTFSAYDNENNVVSTYYGASFDMVTRASFATFDGSGNETKGFSEVTPAQNLLVNGNMENDIDQNNRPDNWTATADTSGTSDVSTVSRLTSKSLRLYGAPGMPKNIAVQQVATIDSGRWFILSAWIKTSGVSPVTGKGSAIAVKAGSDPIVTSAYLKGTNDWQRIGLKFRSPSGATKATIYLVQGGTTGTAVGTTYFDGVQLEGFDNDFATADNDTFTSSFNFLTNSSFENCSSCTGQSPNIWNWTKAPGQGTILLKANDKVNVATPEVDGAYFLQLKLTATYDTAYVRSSDDIAVLSGKDYVLSGFIRGKGVSHAPSSGYASAYLKYYDNQGAEIGSSDPYTLSSLKGWHRFSVSTVPPAGAVKAKVFLSLTGTDAEANFDGIRLTEEKTFSSASYDGNELRLLSSTNSLNQTSSFTYTERGDVETVTSPISVVTKFIYSSLRKLTGIILDEGGKGLKASYDYDLSGNLAKITRYGEGTSKVQRYEYDSSNRPVREIGPEGQETSYSYYSSSDAHAGALRQTMKPSGIQIAYFYDQSGNMSGTEYWDPGAGSASIDIEINSDSEGKPLTVDYNGRRALEYEYWNGRLGRVTDKSEYPGGLNFNKIWETDYGYDEDDRLTSIYESVTQIALDRYFGTEYTLDTLGNTTYVKSGQCNDSSGSCDNDVFDKHFLDLYFAYDERGDMVATSTNPSVVTYRTFDTEHKMLSSYTAKDNTLILKEVVTHDATGSIKRQDLSYRSYTGATQDRTYNYTYDSLSRLTTADIAGTTYGYTYDDFGNIAARKVGATTDIFIYSTSDALTKYQMNGTSYDVTYDADGNMITDGATSYTWNTAGKLRKISTGGTTATFDYEPDGLRHSKTIGNGLKTIFAYDEENNLLSERYASGDLKALYTWANGQVVAITSYCQNCGGMGSYDTYYLHADSTGNVISLTDKNGAVAHTYEYDPYGNIIQETGKNVDNPFKYKGIYGYYTDKETGLIYLQQRYYSPKLMRFLSIDPLNCNCKGEIAQKLTQPLDLNPYAYVMGNPVMGIDPSGELGPLTIPALIWLATQVARIIAAYYFVKGLPSLWASIKKCSYWWKKWQKRKNLPNNGYQPIMNDEGMKIYPYAANHDLALPEWTNVVTHCTDAGAAAAISALYGGGFYLVSLAAKINRYIT